MRTRRVLLAVAVAASIPGAAAAAIPTSVGSAGYPWVQPPAQVELDRHAVTGTIRGAATGSGGVPA